MDGRMMGAESAGAKRESSGGQPRTDMPHLQKKTMRIGAQHSRGSATLSLAQRLKPEAAVELAAPVELDARAHEVVCPRAGLSRLEDAEVPVVLPACVDRPAATRRCSSREASFSCRRSAAWTGTQGSFGEEWCSTPPYPLRCAPCGRTLTAESCSRDHHAGRWELGGRPDREEPAPLTC